MLIGLFMLKIQIEAAIELSIYVGQPSVIVNEFEVVLIDFVKFQADPKNPNPSM